MDKFEYLLAIVEEKNLSRAAEKLYVSQPTLTLYLNRLEDELGVKLFDRSKQPISLTDAGRYYIEKMKLITADEQSLRRDLITIAEPRRVLKVGIGQVRGYYWLPTILPIFCEKHPQINIQVSQLTESVMLEALHANRIDLAFGALPPTISEVEVIDLSRDPILLVAHRKYKLIEPELRNQYSINNPFIASKEALNGLPFIIPQVSNGLYNSYDNLISKNNIIPARIIEINNLMTGLYFAVCGLGVQLIYSSILKMNVMPSIEELDFLTLDTMPFSPKCVVAYDRKNIKINLIEDFIRIVKENLLLNCHTDILY